MQSWVDSYRCDDDDEVDDDNNNNNKDIFDQN